MAKIRELTASDFSGLAWIVYPENRIRWLHVSGNLNLRYSQLALKPGRGLAGQVIRQGRPLIVNSTMEDYEQMKHEYPIMSVENLRSVMALPVLLRQDTDGVLLAGRRTPHAYRGEDLIPLISYAGNAFL